jgi:hypothetical protein
MGAWLLVRKGYLQEMDLFGVKMDFKRKQDQAPTYIDNPKQDSPSLKDYKIAFTQIALDNISALHITKEAITNLVENEFTHHVNYFKWDLLDYPLPVQDGYIVVLDKTGTTVTFRAIKHAQFNELELASLNDLLALYRRLSRFEYRIKDNYVFKPEIVARIINVHKEIIKRLIRHHEIFRGIELPGKERFPSLFIEYISESSIPHGNNRADDARIETYIHKLPDNTKGFAHNITAAVSALFAIDDIIASEENRLISQDEADKEILLGLERSLQYIHKMINTCMLDIH